MAPSTMNMNINKTGRYIQSAYIYLSGFCFNPKVFDIAYGNNVVSFYNYNTWMDNPQGGQDCTTYEAKTHPSSLSKAITASECDPYIV